VAVIAVILHMLKENCQETALSSLPSLKYIMMENEVTESNGFIRILAKSSEVDISAYVH